jgi:hypothetical protein
MIKELIPNLVARLLDKYVKSYGEDVLERSADTLQNNIAYNQARENILLRIVAEWVATKPDEASKREQLYFEVCALGRVQTELNMFVFNNEKVKDNG